MTDQAKSGPSLLKINVFSDLPTIPACRGLARYPLYLISGMLMFILLPLSFGCSTSLSSGNFICHLQGRFQRRLGLCTRRVDQTGNPGPDLGLSAPPVRRHSPTFWWICNHAAHHNSGGASSAIAVLVVSLGLTIVLGAKLFGLY